MSEVKLVSVSMPRNIDGVNSAEEFIAYAARVSNPGNQINNETATKLLRYLAKHSHWSPFEMVSLTLEIKTTRDIGRQILRHRSFSFQEFSQRYAEVTDQFEIREARLQDNKNRQNSIKVDDEKLAKAWEEMQQDVAQICRSHYENALKLGVAKEQARAVLPEGMTKSTMYMAGTLRSFWHFISVRNHPATQKECREIAEKVTVILKQEFPSLTEMLEEMIENNYKV
jgi:thymidylate synthase (FAD)